ncbi:MAG: hypothetical protein ACOYEV_02985 [Candidatus Nanopelagicales bacterium]
MTLPATVKINAWPGATASGPVDPAGGRWGARREGLPDSQGALPFGPPVDPTDWSDPEVGYGILLPEPSTGMWSSAELAMASDADPSVRDLLAARPGTVVLRWLPALGTRYLRRHFADGASQDPVVGLSSFGVAKGRLPRYILIVADPTEIPWVVQYSLSVRHAVGRLPLSGEPLGNYVTAMLGGFPGPPLSRDAPLIWTVDHGADDITDLMRSTITAPLEAAMSGTLPGVRHLQGGESTVGALLNTLADQQPALVVTSSHGRTEPLSDPVALAAQLGLPIDTGLATVPLDDLSSAMPGGAVWYAQACCSAGADGVSHYQGLLTTGSWVEKTLTAVSQVGAVVAPAPRCLLGRLNPVRAVFGHVEPTFDWTLRVPTTGQGLGGDIVRALTSNAYAGQPLAYAFDSYRAGIGQLHTRYADLRADLAGGDADVRDELTWLRLTALDRQALVMLGDPTVTLA